MHARKAVLWEFSHTRVKDMFDERKLKHLRNVFSVAHLINVVRSRGNQNFSG